MTTYACASPPSPEAALFEDDGCCVSDVVCGESGWGMLALSTTLAARPLIFICFLKFTKP